LIVGWQAIQWCHVVVANKKDGKVIVGNTVATGIVVVDDIWKD
jgi:hypothetical protein